jgi:serine/threonine protein kinase
MVMEPIRLITTSSDLPAIDALKKSLGEHTGASLYKKIVDRVGKEPGAELGHGMKGVVYDLGDGRVLKLTADASEIEAMTLMMKSGHPNLVRVYDVFVVCRGRSGVGVVVREWVGKSLEKIEDFDRMNSRIRDAVDHAEESYEETAGSTDTNAARYAMEDLLAYLENVGDGSAETLKIEHGIRAGIGALMDMGIYGIDFDPRNIAIDDRGNPVIFDVGVVQINARRTVKISRVGCVQDRRIASPIG